MINTTLRFDLPWLRIEFLPKGAATALYGTCTDNGTLGERGGNATQAWHRDRSLVSFGPEGVE